MVPFDESSDQWRPASPRGPVFVDDSGRRLRRVKLVGLAALGLVAGYVILLLVAFMGGSNVAAPFLPLPAAPAPRALPSSPVAPASPTAGVQAGEPRTAGPAAPAAVQAPAAAVQAPANAVRARVTTVQAPAAPDTVVPLAPPATTAARQPAPRAATTAPSTAPGMSGTAQGQTTRPSPPPHP